jgi:hypothetical protein
MRSRLACAIRWVCAGRAAGIRSLSTVSPHRGQLLTRPRLHKFLRRGPGVQARPGRTLKRCSTTDSLSEGDGLQGVLMAAGPRLETLGFTLASLLAFQYGTTVSGDHVTPRRTTTLACLVLFWFATASSAHAYVGPGSGLSVIGAALAFLAAIALAVVGFVWYPVKRLWRALSLRRARGQTGPRPPQSP